MVSLHLLTSLTAKKQGIMFGIGNYYGGLEIKEEGGKLFWGIENYDGIEWEEIPKYLYDALVKFRNEPKCYEE